MYQFILKDVAGNTRYTSKVKYDSVIRAQRVGNSLFKRINFIGTIEVLPS